MIGNAALSGSRVDWRVCLAVGLWLLMGFAAVLLTGRALAGAFDVRVSAVVPAVTTAIATMGGVWAWWLYQRAHDGQRGESISPVGDVAAGFASLAAPALIGWSTTVNASPFAAGIVTGILVLGLTAVVVCEGVRMPPAVTQSPEPTIESITARNSDLVQPLSEPAVAAAKAEVVQQFVRHAQPDGSERIEATLMASFAAGDRETVVHLPIHPVLRRSPHVECEPLDESPVTITVTTAEPYGIRVALKRAAATESLHVPVGIEISTSKPVVGVA